MAAAFTNSAPADSGVTKALLRLRDSVALRIFAGVVALWLLVPALFPVHVEGFSASIQSIGIHIAAGDLAHFDTQFPFDLEFFTTSRIGMNLFVAALYKLAPFGADWPMRLAMGLGLLSLACSSGVLVRRWVDTTKPVAWAGIAAVLLLMPGVSESAFFYNDNMLGAGLLVASLAMAVEGFERAGGWLKALAGVTFGAAVLVRTDAILLAPAFVLCGVTPWRGWRDLLASASAFGLCALLPLWLIPASLGLSLADTVAAARHAIELWDRPLMPLAHLRNIVFFIGLPGLFLAGLGVVVLAERHAWRQLVLLVGPPLIYNIAYFGKAWQVRQLLPMTPFIGALIALGGFRLWGFTLRHKRNAAACLVLLLAQPPSLSTLADGPRAMVGRLWMPALWLQWQHEVRSDFDRLNVLIADLPAQAVVITDDWNADRYLHLRLQQAGFHVESSIQALAGCSRWVETFRREAQTLRHLRLHTPFVPYQWLLTGQRYQHFAADCGPAFESGTVFYAAPSNTAARFASAAQTPKAGYGDLLEAWTGRRQYPLIAIPMDAAKLEGLRALYAGYAQLSQDTYGAHTVEGVAGEMAATSRRFAISPTLASDKVVP